MSASAEQRERERSFHNNYKLSKIGVLHWWLLTGCQVSHGGLTVYQKSILL